MIENIYLKKIDSTNLFAKQHKKEFDPQKITCITAEEQTQGYGQFQRKWFSPKGNLFSTFFFTLSKDIKDITTLAQIMGYTIASVFIEDNLSPTIKWPNDILLSCKKVAGTLCETNFTTSIIEVFLGIGINVNMQENELEKIDQPATSLFLETNSIYNLEDLLKKIQIKFSENLQAFKEKGFEPFHYPINNLLAYKNKKIILENGQRKWEGICHSINNRGELNLYLDSKELKSFSAGKIINSCD